MLYYRLNIQTIPTVEVAHGFTTEHYQIIQKPIAQKLELVYVERGDLIFTDKDGTVSQYNTRSYITFPKDIPGVYTSTDGCQTHFTVIVRGGPDFFRRCTAEEVVAMGNEESTMYAILPETVSEAEGSSDYEKLIKRLIECHQERDAVSRTRRTALLYELFARLTEYSFTAASGESGKPIAIGNPYYRRAVKYITAHLDQRIYVADIAREVGVSVGYLSHIFRTAAGCTMVDYINKQKLNLVCEWIATKNITLEEAGQLVGIHDVKYLSRLFKRYNGVTSEAYRTLHNTAGKGRRST